MTYTYDQINALTGYELNKAVAKADGWHWWQPDGWNGYRYWLKNNRDQRLMAIYPDYTSGALIDRIVTEIDPDDVALDDGSWTIYNAGWEEAFKSESLTTAILRAWIWHKQEQK